MWLHRDRSELLWLVGDARRFNAQGGTPTNTTYRDLLRRADENDWHHGEVIRLLAAMAALFHDFGKACIAFQIKLRRNEKTREAYRHEWVSLRLFEALVGDAPDDKSWLEKLADPNLKLPDWKQHLVRDGVSQRAPAPLKRLPDLARSIGWLILTHHLLPTKKGELPRSRTLATVETAIKPGWGYENQTSDKKARSDCWTFRGDVPLISEEWRRHAARTAREMLKHGEAMTRNWLENPYVAHLSRLSLMLADHSYSAQPALPRFRAKKGSDSRYVPYANTDSDGKLKQRLDEHLIGVGINASRIVRALPSLNRRLPRIARHRGFRRRTRNKRFLWQNRAFDLTESLRTRAAGHGYFGVNMASTGCGKTLANGRILYALADPRLGARFTVALGLRILTLQTGDAYRDRLGLGSEDLAVLVGGGAVRDLYRRQKQKELQEHEAFEHDRIPGSESANELLAEQEYVHFEGSLEDGPLNRWLETKPRALIQAPIVACTLDHLAPATEGTRGGRQILPMLRLLTSDLVLDEVDDFDVKDLPAVTRLVHWAGLLGSRILLSSATMPPALVQGLFQAYCEGRRSFQSSRGEPGTPLNICCAWIDEFNAQSSDHSNMEGFRAAHERFVAKRVKSLDRQVQRRHAEIGTEGLDVSGGSRVERRTEILRQLATSLREQMLEMHGWNHEVHPDSGKAVSVGLVRMANIDPLIMTARFLAAAGMPESYRLHLCIYHSRFPLMLRSEIEARLDRVLKRDSRLALSEDEWIRQRLEDCKEEQHIFVVMATPVAEVGRDHDYDWAIVEPSSMRSVIQLAGRVRRHRPHRWERTNIVLLRRNVRGWLGDRISYCRPGYECNDAHLESHDLEFLLREAELRRIDSTARIREHDPLEPASKLADLEQYILGDVMLGLEGKTVPATLWWETRAHLTGLLQQKYRFRAGPPTTRYVLMPDEEEELELFELRPDGAMTPQNYQWRQLEIEPGRGVDWWPDADECETLKAIAGETGMNMADCARKFATVDLPEGMDIWRYHRVMGFSREKAGEDDGK